MRKLLLYSIASIASISATHSHATAYPYYGLARSGTPTSSLASFNVQTPSSTPVESRWYVPVSSGSASNLNTSPIRLEAGSEWTFDFANPAAVAFTGNLQIGSYRIQTQTVDPQGLLTTDGRISFTGVTIAFSGVGTYNEATNTFSYSSFNSALNGGGASIFSSASATCQNGHTTTFASACSTFAPMSKNWEGLTLSFVFDEARTQFSGGLQGIDTFGSGISRRTVGINWTVAAGPAVQPEDPIPQDPVLETPIPAPAWLFGSALLCLAGQRMRGCR